MLGPKISTSGRPYYRFRGLGAKRWLLPTSTTLRRAALELYTPYNLKGRLLKTLMYLGASKKVHVHELSLSELEQNLADALGEPEVRLAFYHPVQPDRCIVLIMTPEGVPLAFGRMAGTEKSRRDLEHELRILHRVRNVPDLKAHVPEPLAFLNHEGTKILVIGAGPSQKGPAEWRDDHTEIVQKLHGAFQREMRLASSPFWHHIETASRRYRPHLSDAWKRRYDNAMSELGRFADQSWPMSLAHGDFAPWNTRLSENGLFVFDWDYAREIRSPNYDYFHFRYMTSLRLGPGVDAQQVSEWLRTVPVETALPNEVLLLAYLLDLCLFYQHDIGTETYSESVMLEGAKQLLDDLTQWYI